MGIGSQVDKVRKDVSLLAHLPRLALPCSASPRLAF